MDFCIYDSITGQVHMGGTCADADYEHQVVPEGCGILPLAGRPDMHYVATGALIPVPPRPDEWAKWSWDEKRWIASPTADVLELRWRHVRAERNRRIAMTDWTQGADVPTATQELWQPYRQALRNVTNQPDPAAIDWPVPPQALQNMPFVS